MLTYTSLLNGIEYSGTAPDGEPTLITQDSRKVEPGAVFVCIEGRQTDGHDHAAKALENGAGLIVSQRPLGLAKEVTVQDTRHTLAALCQNYFGNPAQQLTQIAVTGTNGKTTVSYIIYQLLQQLGASCGLIGSIQSEVGGMQVPAKFTTPEAWDIAALQSRMVAAGCTHVVLEASSQGLEQGRLYGQSFKLGVFTNLSQDHLDYHHSMESYFAAKQSLFNHCDVAVINQDDAWGERLLDSLDDDQKISYSTDCTTADLIARNVDLRAGEVRFALLGPGYLHRVQFPMPGEYSVYNALAAAAAVIALGYDSEEVAAALAHVKPVRGRCEVLYNGPFTVIRDFAHTADGIDQLLGALHPFVEGAMHVVYGCAGQRDAEKRPAMSEAVLKWANRATLTADNPRLEPVEETMQDALPPLEKGAIPYTIEPDRQRAIEEALSGLQEGDLLVLCGKGHEDYQVLNGYTVFLDEAMIVNNWLGRNDNAVPRHA